MSRDTLPPGEVMGRQVERRRYTVGFSAALALTLAAFAAVLLPGLPRPWPLGLILGLGLVQVVVHLHYFLHIDLRRSHRDDLLLVLFTSLIILLMVAGTLWILFDLEGRMSG
jgi:cytochrome o ubiquinol oxidase operon protein cyoD